MYERHVGYTYEQKGFDVIYSGILYGYKDLGRDLICIKDDVTIIVQCKYWSSKSVIHEKYIHQLFGTTVNYYLEKINPNGNLSDYHNYREHKKIVPVLITSASISESAKVLAKSLKVNYLEHFKLGEFI